MDLLSRNLEAMGKVDPDLADWIVSGPELDWVELIRSPDGTPNLLLTVGTRKVPAYASDRPLDPVRQGVKRADREKNSTSFIIGMGLGHQLAEVLNVCEKGHTVVVVEVHPHLVRLALGEYDFSEAIAAEQVIISRPDNESILSTLVRLGPGKLGSTPSLSQEAYTVTLNRDYSQPLQSVIANVTAKIGQFSTLATRGLMVSTNQVSSLPRILRSPGVATQIGPWRGKPAIIVASGPSLGKNIHLLKEAKGKALIISLAQSLRSLLAYDVVPDTICAVDMQPIFLKHLTGLLTTEEVPFVASCNTCTEALTKWQGACIAAGVPTQGPAANHYLSLLWAHKGRLELDSAASHMAFRLATLIEADPIIFVGLDLAQDGDSTYFDQYRLRLDPEEDAEIIKSQSRLEEQPLLVPGYYSRVVQSKKNWRTQLTHFERLIKDCPARIINATEGGARIEGTEQLTLAEVIELYCTQPCGPSDLKNPLTTDPQGDLLIDEVLPLLKNETEILRTVIHHTRPALAANQKMRRLVEKGSQEATGAKRYRRLAKENDRHTLAAQKAAERIPVLIHSIFGAYKSALGLMPDDEMDAETRLDLGLTKNKTMLSSTQKAARHLIEAYENTVDILDRYVTCRDALKKSQTDPDLLVEMAVILEEMGFAAEAGLNLRNALELAPEEPVYWEALGRLALKREKFKEVEECCEHLERLPGEEEATRRLRQDLDVALGGLLAEVEEDFLEGNFAFPLLNARKYLDARPDETEVRETLDRAVRRRDEKIAQAEAQAREFKEAMAGELGRQKRYGELLKQSKAAGREEKNFEASLKLLQEAVELIPELPEARWGMATTLHHLGRTEESLEAFRGLVEASPDNVRYRFEMGMVMLDLGRVQEGLAQIALAMDGSKQFDSFLPRMATYYRALKRHDEALSAYDNYLKSFQADFEAWTQRGDCLAEMGKLFDALGSYEQALSLRPDFELALAHKSKVEMVTNGNGQTGPTDGLSRG